MKMRFASMIAAATMFSAPATALNMSGFEDAPFTRLNSEEVLAYRAFVLKTLDESAEGKTAEWSAAKTKFTTKVTPGKSFADGNLKCREAVIDSDSGDRQMRGRYAFCKGDTGDWQFRSAGGRGK